MAHTTKAIRKKRISDGQIAVLLRCCDDASTDSWHTLNVVSGMQATDIRAWVQEQKAAVQALHQARLDADAALDAILGT